MTVKIAVDSKTLNKSIQKNKYQSPNNDNLNDTKQRNLNTIASNETADFSTLDLKYACSHLQLNAETSRHCNFNTVCG